MKFGSCPHIVIMLTFLKSLRTPRASTPTEDLMSHATSFRAIGDSLAMAGLRLAAAVSMSSRRPGNDLPPGLLCSALASLVSSQQALLAGGATHCDKLLLTVNMTAANRAFVNAASGRRVIILDVADKRSGLSRIWTRIPPHLLPYSLKLAVIGLAQYDGVLVTDADAFFISRQPWDPRVQPWLYDRTGPANTYSPLNAGRFAVRPSPQREATLLAALRRRFSATSGWGGNYSEGLRDIVRAYRRPVVQRCSENTSWCFIGADIDQGLLVHLLASEEHFGAGFLLNSSRFAFDRNFVHFTPMSPKPLEAIAPTAYARAAVQCKQDSTFASKFDRFWRLWKMRLGPLLAQSSPACPNEARWALERWERRTAVPPPRDGNLTQPIALVVSG